MEFKDEVLFKDKRGIYKIVNAKTNGVYVGQTTETFQRRFWLHRWKLKNNCHDNKHLQKSWNKHGGDAFEFSVIEECDNQSIDERERFWISFFRENGLCYNIQDGGQPESLSRYISESSRKITGEKNRQHMLGSKASEKTKLKMSKTRTGKRICKKNDSITDEEAKKIKEMLLIGKSSGEIMKDLNLPYKPINAILSNNAYSTIRVDGWDVFYERHLSNVRKNKQRGEKIKVDLLQGDSVAAIAKRYGVDRHTVDYYKRKIKQVS